MHQVYIMRWKYNEVAGGPVRVPAKRGIAQHDRERDEQCATRIPYAIGRMGGREGEGETAGGKAIAEGINSRYSRNIGATKCKLIGKRGARGGTGGEGEGEAGQRANIDALTMQANYVLVRVRGYGVPGTGDGAATTIAEVVVGEVCSGHQPGHFAIVIRPSAHSLRLAHRRNPPLN